MTPQEHYDAAESALTEAHELRNGEDISETDGEVTMRARAAVLATSIGALHAKLAEVGLLLRRDEDAPFADEIDDRNARFEKAHDFPADTATDLGVGRNCRKCGRCENHSRSECTGPNKTLGVPRVCLVCVHIGRETKIDD